jgi:branched-chain amino acid transport system substrate-binding protein
VKESKESKHFFFGHAEGGLFARQKKQKTFIPTFFSILAWVFPAHAQSVRVAMVGPLSGDEQSIGEQMRIGAEQAVADINAEGGVLGHKLELVVADDGCDPHTAVRLANQLARKGVKLIDGHACAAASVRASKVYLLDSVLQITPVTTARVYSDDGAWNLFRLAGRDDTQAQAAAAYLSRHFANGQIALAYDNTPYGRDLAEQIRTALQQAGKPAAVFAACPPGEEAASGLAERLQAAAVDVLYFAGGPAEAAALLRAMRAQHLATTLMGNDTLSGADFRREAAAEAEGTVVTRVVDPAGAAQGEAVVARLAEHQHDAEGLVLPAYAAIEVWAAAANKARSETPKKIAATLKSSGPWSSVIGPVTFDSKGDRVGVNYEVDVWTKSGLRPASES